MSTTSKFLLFATLALVAYSQNLTCQNPNGTNVDWYLILKYPGNLTTSNPRYAYIDSTYTTGEFSILQGTPDQTGGALANTITLINQAYLNALSILIWNDEPSNETWSPGGAHSKGILAFTNSTNTGVYLLHSAPKYPNIDPDTLNISYSLPRNTWTYGQHFYCINLNQESFNTIVGNLQVIEPVIYYRTGIFVHMNFQNPKPLKISKFNLVNGDQQIMLSKNPNFLPYLYEYIMLPYLGTDLLVESWGRPYLPGLCSPEGMSNSLNINQVEFANGDYWNHYEDHSKWAVTSGTNNPQLACLCDMNRMETQDLRGGSCLCSNNEYLYGAMSAIVLETDSCSQSGLFKRKKRL